MVRQRETLVRSRRGSDRLSEAFGDALIDALATAADGAFVSDAEGTVLFWNTAARAILGYRELDALGRPCCTLLCGNGVNRARLFRCAIGREAAARKSTPSFEMQAKTKGGLSLWISMSVLTVADRRTRTSFFIHLFRDVSFATEQLALAHEGLESAASNGAEMTLTRREREILRLMGDGLNTADMARRLHLSRATIRNHVQNILLKLDVHSRLEAVAYGRRHRLL
jgi:PAS domain S-box-containing protein